MDNIRLMIKRRVPSPILKTYHFLLFLYCSFIDLFAEMYYVLSFLCKRKLNKTGFLQRLSIIKRFYRISWDIDCRHTQGEMFDVVSSILSMPKDIKGCIVEAGTFKGGSAAKYSIAAKISDRQLVIFDSFEGMPNNVEAHEKNIYGDNIKGYFNKGEYCGALEEVKNNIRKYGDIEVCKFIKGWFDGTMSKYSEKIAIIFMDVDLASSTKTCIKYLYPLLSPGGALYSQDGAFPLVIDVFKDKSFWENQIGCQMPYIEGLGQKKLIKITKPIG